MARYIGPKTKIARKFGEAIYGEDKYFDRRKYAPGQHGSSRRRKSLSDYGVQLKEKQKAKYIYGLLERQFRNVFEKASRKDGVTGEILLQMLEARLDNVVYRLGIASTRSQARQFVGHKHILVNGDVVNIPSYQLRIGDVVEVRERSKSLEPIKASIGATTSKFEWLEFDPHAMKGRLISLPERELIPENINEQLIVELYSK